MRRQFAVFSLVAVIGTATLAHFVWPSLWWAMVVIAPVVALGLYDMFQAAGILPAGKNTPEIAAIRTVEPYTDVKPPARSSPVFTFCALWPWAPIWPTPLAP